MIYNKNCEGKGNLKILIVLKSYFLCIFKLVSHVRYGKNVVLIKTYKIRRA